MVITTVQAKHLDLPESFATRFNGKTFEILETEDGLLLKPIEDVISLAKGCLKGLGFSSQRFTQLKQEEKELER